MAAVFSPLDPNKLEDVANAFGLAPLNGSQPITDGSVNTIYRLVSRTGAYYLRLEEVKSPAELAVELELCAYLADHGFPCPKPLHPVKDKKAWFYVLPGGAGKPIAVMPEMSGQALRVEDYDPEHLRQIGALLGKLHLTAQSFKKSLQDRFSAEAIAEKFKKLKPALVQDLRVYVDGIAAEIALQEREAPRRSQLPQGIVHGDFFADNLFFTGERLTGLIDFDAAARRELIFDLATAANALCYQNGQFNWGLLRALFQGYEDVRTLVDAERAQWLMVWRLSSLRFTVTRIQDFHLRTAGESGLIHRDFRDFYNRLQWQQGLTPEKFWQDLGGKKA